MKPENNYGRTLSKGQPLIVDLAIGVNREGCQVFSFKRPSLEDVDYASCSAMLTVFPIMGDLVSSPV